MVPVFEMHDIWRQNVHCRHAKLEISDLASAALLSCKLGITEYLKFKHTGHGPTMAIFYVANNNSDVMVVLMMTIIMIMMMMSMTEVV